MAAGDELAFKQLFRLYIPFLEPAITRLVKNKAAAEDILQEAFLRLWLHRDQLATVENPRSWVLRIVYNRAFTFLANEQKYRNHLDALAVAPAQEALGPQETLSYNIVRRLVSTAVEQLPAQQKKVYRLSRDHGMRIAEIADTLKLSSQTVKNTLGRAIQSIRAYLEAAGYVFILFFF